jgi:hypothetical protein
MAGSLPNARVSGGRSEAVVLRPPRSDGLGSAALWHWFHAVVRAAAKLANKGPTLQSDLVRIFRIRRQPVGGDR